jgi:hypothetical protein
VSFSAKEFMYLIVVKKKQKLSENKFYFQKVTLMKASDRCVIAVIGLLFVGDGKGHQNCQNLILG